MMLRPDEAPDVGSGESKQPQSPMPTAKLTAGDESYQELEGGSEEAVVETRALVKGGGNVEDVKAEKGEVEEFQDHSQMTGEGREIGSVGVENEPEAGSNLVPHSNGGHHDGLGEAAVTHTMPMAKLSSEDEDVIEEREDDELNADGQPEEDNEELLEGTTGVTDNQDGGLPSKIKAVLSDLDDNVILPQSAYENPTQEPDDIGNNDEKSVPAKVPNSFEQGEENQTRPIAKLSDQDDQSPEDQPVSSRSPEVISRDLPAEVFEGTEVSKSVDDGATKGDESAEEMAEAEEETFPVNVDDLEEERDGEDEEDEDDGRGSHGSGESFDSALEHMAASSEAGFDAGSSPKMSSPVGSLHGPVLLGNPPTVLSPAQQGALIRLNEMISGDSSMDTSVIDNSTREEFKSRVIKLAHSRGQSEEDLSFVSIVDALLPLVPEKLTEDGQVAEAEDSVATNDEVTEPLRRMPKAKLFAEEEQEEEQEAVENRALENGHGHAKEVNAENGDESEAPQEQVEPELTQKEAPGTSDTEEGTDVPVNFVPDGNGEAEQTNGEVDAQDDLPLKPRAILSDLHDSEVLDHSENRTTIAEPTENGDNLEYSSPTEVPEASAGIQDSFEEPDEIQISDVPEFDPAAPEGNDGLKVFPEANGEGKNESLVEDSDEEEEQDDEEDDDENEEDEDSSDMSRSEALAALLRAAQSPHGGDGAAPPSLGSAGPSLPARPSRVVRSTLPSLEPAPRAAQNPRSTDSAAIRSSGSADESQAHGEAADGNEETREKLQSIRVKFLRLALRLGQSAHNVVVAQVLYRLGLAEQLRGGRSSSRNTAFSFDRASSIAEEQERAGPEELDFACTIMMLGKTGVGKSATINSIFDEVKTGTDAFSPSTNKVRVITGHVHGIKVRVIDTPGLLPSVVDQRHNERIMASVKGFIKKQSPDIVLYFDRLDMQSRDYGDLPLLRTITDTFGAAVWFNAIVVLTHASSAPPDGPNGLPLSYEMFVAQRSHVVQQTIRQAAGDMRLMNPVSLVENHRACRVNRSGDRVLPNGQVWKPQLLLLCFASKILAEANSFLKLQDNTPGKGFGQRSRVPPLPFLLSSLLQSRTPMKLPDEQVGDEDESDEELEEDDSSDEEEDYDQLPPFRRLAKDEIAELDEESRANYFEELAERERLFQKKQWKEELKRRREMKKRMAEAPTDQSQFGPDDGLDEEARSAAVPVPMPDMQLPPSFDSDNPSHRYRYLETANQWLVRPVLETHGWDHDNGYDGMSVEKMFVIGDRIPTSVSGQVTKDKKEANLNMEVAASLKHGEGKVTLAGLDMQTVGKDLAYTMRSETRFSNFKGNKTTGGLAVTLLGDTVSAGMKIEDRLLVGKRVKLVVNGGAITGGGDVAYGGSLEATLRGKDFPLSRTLSTLGVSVMDWHGDLAVGGNLQSQFILGKTMMVGRANLNNRGAGQVSIRASSSEQLQMTLIGILPIVRAIANRLFGQSQQ